MGAIGSSGSRGRPAVLEFLSLGVSAFRRGRDPIIERTGRFLKDRSAAAPASSSRAVILSVAASSDPRFRFSSRKPEALKKAAISVDRVFLKA